MPQLNTQLTLESGKPEPGAYFLGLPAWGFPGWSGRYFNDEPSRLASYAQVLDTVEGNTTFYRIPDAATVDRWAQAVHGQDFRFSFKLPREVTHERRPDWQALRRFLTVMEPLAECLGPWLVQFPATLGPEHIEVIEAVLEQLPAGSRAAVEVRHLDFFRRPQDLRGLCEAHRATRVMFDSRPIYGGDTGHPEVLAARHKKPDVPLLDTVYGELAYARVVLHPDLAFNRTALAQWVSRTAACLLRGDDVYMMIHCPNNLHCPAFALQFHQALQEALPAGFLPDLPHWPVPQQSALF